MRAGHWTEVVALVAAQVISVLSTLAGVCGVVLLLPFQVSVLGTPTPSVRDQPGVQRGSDAGALYPLLAPGQTGERLALVLIAGTLPGGVAGSVIRARLIPGPRIFDAVVAAVLILLGTWLALSRPAETCRTVGQDDHGPALVVLAIGVDCVGGISALSRRLLSLDPPVGRGGAGPTR